MEFKKVLIFFSFPDLKLLHVAKAHPGTCICIEMDPKGRYFATGSADALVSLWDVKHIACVRVFSRLDETLSTLVLLHSCIAGYMFLFLKKLCFSILHLLNLTENRLFR